MTRTDPLSLAAGAGARLWRAGVLVALLWALVAWAMAPWTQA